MTNGSLKRKRRAAAAARGPEQTAPSPARTVAVTHDEAGMRLDRWFKRRLPNLSLSHLNKIVRTGQVRVDGARVKTAARLEAGQNVRIPPLTLETPTAPPIRRATSSGDAAALREIMLFEDRDILVLNKPFGLAVQGGSGTSRHVDAMLEALADEHGERPRLVHRLDRDTSGVLLVAKTRRVAADLGELFRSRQAKKVYWAVVEGVPKPAQGRISLFLAKGEGMERARGGARELERMRVARHGEADAQHSVTYYAIVEKVAPKLAWLSMKPLTGRTHQLRAHAEAIGHPIIGDPKYGHRAQDDERRRDPMRAIPADIQRKLHLLARRLILPHPRGGTIDVTAPLPPHMQRTFHKFGFDAKQYDPIEGAPDA
jgi:23S rRNA pseudouridine955/2504/2580 synthase